jgi:Ca2+-binding EF-hand superfamily protein
MKMTTLAMTLLGAAALALGVQAQAQDSTAGQGKGFGNRVPQQQAGPGRGGRLQPPRGQQGRSMMARRHAAGQAMARLDANDDGMIDLDEFLARFEDRPQHLLERRDVNEDGVLSRDELEPPARPQRPEIDRAAVTACVQEEFAEFADEAAPGARFDALDSNDDAVLDASELDAGRLARAEAQFTRLDTDVDGLLTPEELHAGHADRRELDQRVRACTREVLQSATP